MKFLVGCWLFIIGSQAGAVPENTYTVPVEEALKTWGTFIIEDAELRLRDDGRAKLEYTFPDVLIGQKDFKIEAKGTWHSLSEPLKLQGQFAEFTCTVNQRLANCKAVYNRKTLPVLLPDGVAPVEDYLKSTMYEEGELLARQEVVQVFSHEAAGTFENLRIRFK